MARHSNPHRRRVRSLWWFVAALTASVLVVAGVLITNTRDSGGADASAGGPSGGPSDGTSVDPDADSSGSGSGPNDATEALLAACEQTHKVRAVVPTLMAEPVRLRAAEGCVDLDLVAADGRAGAAESGAEGVGLWITDSSLWTLASSASPGEGVSIASSPVVAVAQPAVADRVGPNGRLDYNALLVAGKKFFLGFQDPASTASGLLAAYPVLEAQRAADPTAYRPLALTSAALTNPITIPTDWVSRPGPEQLVFGAEYAVDPGPNASVLRADSEPAMDFPAYNLSSGTSAEEPVAQLIATLASAEFAEDRAALRLRNPDGSADFDTAGLGEAGTTMRKPNRATAVRLYGLSASGSARGRSLVALDVSGSMATRLPAGGTLFDTVRSTALLAMSALYDHTAIGLWTFGSNLDGPRDYREVVPIRRLKVNRKVLLKRVETIGPVPGSGTGLYDTIAAGYREVLDTYEPGAVHSLVVMTDGKNDDEVGLSQRQLLTELKAAQDPEKPVLFVGVGFGKADLPALQRVADVTGGRAVAVRDPLQMLGVLITIVGELALQPTTEL